jgi:short-subunit dehydrogenase
MAAKYEGEDFRRRFGAWAVIAGGSDGIGRAYARELARRGVNVALIARRREALEATANAIAEETGVETRSIPADLTSADVADVIARESADLDVGLFVYNAGASRTAEKFADLPVAELMFMMNLNCRGPLLLAHHFAGRLRERRRGGLILMSSLACLAGCAYQSVYSATKAFDTILAEGLWQELAPEGVDVLSVMAGATKTESMLHSGDKFDDAMDPNEVAVSALDHLGKGPNWVPGETNQAVARGMWPTPRVPIINAMSQATAGLFDVEHIPVAGIEFHEANATKGRS